MVFHSLRTVSILVFVLFITLWWSRDQVPLVAAQTLESPSPSVFSSPSLLPSPEVSPAPTLLEPSPSPASEISPSPTPITTDAAPPETTQEPAISSPTATDSARTIQHRVSNEVVQIATFSAVVNTGENQQVASDSAMVTGDARVKVTTENQHNTTVIGSATQPVVINHTSPLSTNLNLNSSPSPAMSEPSPTASASTEISNAASVKNEITVTANTGENQQVGRTAELQTGEAEAAAYLQNMLNTTIIGQCWYFGAINIFEPFEGSIILPNAEEYTRCPEASVTENEAAPSEKRSTSIEIENQANVNDEFSLQTDTGDNQLKGQGQVQTGQSQSQTGVIAHVNTTFIGDEWWLIRISNPDNWAGELHNLGSDYEVFSMNNQTYIGWRKTDSSSRTETGGADIKIKNQAELNNLVKLQAETGGNQIAAETARLQTGSASTIGKIVSYVNTSLIGNRWYLLDLNLLAPFRGRVEMARPDLVLNVTGESSVTAGQSTEFGAKIQNQGLTPGRDITVTLSLPQGVHIVESSEGAVISEQNIEWRWSVLEMGEEQAVWVRFKTDEKLSGEGFFRWLASTPWTELDITNNQAQQLLRVAPIVRTTSPVTRSLAPRITRVVKPMPVTRPNQVKNRTVLAAAAEPQVLGAQTSLAPALLTAMPSTQRRNISYCSRQPFICNAVQLGFAGVLGSLWISKRKFRLI